jgi:hypothetical protein
MMACPGAYLVISACLAQINSQDLLKEISEIDALMGTAELREHSGDREGETGELVKMAGNFPPCRLVSLYSMAIVDDR